MDKFFSDKIIKNKSGQSAVEYILLLAVISSLSIVMFKNKRWLDFIGGKASFFAEMKLKMAYSYRYGRSPASVSEIDRAMPFNYENQKHDTYLDSTTGKSRFFTNSDKYPQ